MDMTEITTRSSMSVKPSRGRSAARRRMRATPIRGDGESSARSPRHGQNALAGASGLYGDAAALSAAGMSVSHGSGGPPTAPFA